jgi:hypothetical protein
MPLKPFLQDCLVMLWNRDGVRIAGDFVPEHFDEGNLVLNPNLRELRWNPMSWPAAIVIRDSWSAGANAIRSPLDQ